MRSKLLRALRHLKAAFMHLQRADALIAHCYQPEARAAVAHTMNTMHDAITKTKAGYSQHVYSNVSPAELK